MSEANIPPRSGIKGRPSVALIIETSVIYGRQILHGISNYLRTNGEWSVFLDERDVFSSPPEWLLDWDGDGIICRWTSPELAERLKHGAVPVVDLNDSYGYMGLPRIGSDMRTIGRVAAEHLLERGFVNIAFCGFSEPLFSRERLEGAMATVEQRGIFCGAFESSVEGLRELGWETERREISKWLANLPRPLGIVACNDARGYHVLDACRDLGLVVPEEVAVIGVDNAETFCELCYPPLSSVVPNAERIGSEAAKLLGTLMEGGKPEIDELLIAPTEVITRQSSDVLAVSDPVVAKAIDLIRREACDGLHIAELLETLHVPRQKLERGFRQFLGHSPHEEIRRVRLKRVKQLLLETNWTLERIAEKAGFEHTEYMMVQFKRLIGRTPGQWRIENRRIAESKTHTPGSR